MTVAMDSSPNKNLVSSGDISNSLSAEIVFDDLSPIEVPVRIDKKRYILREASEDAACKWRNSIFKNAKLGVDGRPTSIDGMADSEPLLVALCLYQADDEGRLRLTNENTPDPRYLVSLQTIRRWPQKVVKTLFERAKEISQLNEEETPEAMEKQMTSLAKRLAEARKGDAEMEIKLAQIRVKMEGVFSKAIEQGRESAEGKEDGGSVGDPLEQQAPTEGIGDISH